MRSFVYLVLAGMFRNSLAFTVRHSSQERTALFRLASTKSRSPTTLSSAKLLNLSSVTKEDLTTIVTSWGHPKFRADQIWQWIRVNGVTDVEQMNNLPKTLRAQLREFSQPSVLKVALEQTSKDGTIKRAYQCHDGQLIESVLMPYDDGRYTACISSQAGRAQGCVFCATGQMGFARQLTSDEIFEQVARFAAELQRRDERGTATNKTHGKATRLSSTYDRERARKRWHPQLCRLTYS